jgi:hypothetical protein
VEQPDNDIKIDTEGNLLVAEHTKLIQQRIAETLGINLDLLFEPEDNPKYSRAKAEMEYHQMELDQFREMMKASMTVFLDRMVANSGIKGWGIDGVWTITGYTLDKHGFAYWQMVGEDGKPRTEKVRGRRFGPHRPRRTMRAYLNQQIGNVNMDWHLLPIIPIKFVTVDLIVTKLDGQFDLVKAEIGPLATDAEAQDTMDYFETLKVTDAQTDDPPAE